MKTFLFFTVALFGLGWKATAADLNSESWTAMSADGKSILFKAQAAFQLTVTYNTTANKMETAMLNFTQVKAASTITGKLDGNITTVSIKNSDAVGAELIFNFLKGNTTFYLKDVSVTFNQSALVNGTTDAGVVTANITDPRKLFMTPVSNSYACTMGTEIMLNPVKINDKVLLVIGGKGFQLQVSGEKNFSTASSCFSDQKHEAFLQTWDFLFNKTAVCARIQSMASVTVQYQTIFGETATTTIPFPNASLANAMGECKENMPVTASVELDGPDVTMHMVFSKNSSKMLFAVESYALTEVTLMYNTLNRYFPNHNKLNTTVTVQNKTISVNPVMVGISYECLVHQSLIITPDLTLVMDKTQWEAFNVAKTGFHNSSQCSAMHPTTPVPPTTPHPDPAEPPVFTWKPTDPKNVTCFMATAGLQFRAYYNKTGEKERVETRFDFTNESMVSTSECKGDSIIVTFHQRTRNQTVQLTFKNMKTEYALTKVELTFEILNSTFVNASQGMHKMVTVSSVGGLKLLPTPANSTYSCTMETQVALSGVDTYGVADIYLRITRISDLQAFVPPSVKPKATKCFIDQPHPQATKGDWKIKTAANSSDVCARITSVLELKVSYLDISQKLQLVTIPVQGQNVTIISSSCAANTTTLTLDAFLDKSMMLTLTYNKTNISSFALMSAIPDVYFLNDVMLEYSTLNPYFQNHESFNSTITIKPMKPDLGWFQTNVGNSFQCNTTQPKTVKNITSGSGMEISFSLSQWQAFGINKTGNFNKAYQCPADLPKTTPMTTTPVTPHPDFPKDPVVEHFVAKSPTNVTCFIAHIGVQFRTMYFSKKENQTEIGFNLQTNNTKLTATCSGNMSQVTFDHDQAQIQVMMTFVMDKHNMTYLDAVSVHYNDAKFPNINGTTGNKSFDVNDLGLFKTNKAESYKCSNETDILVDTENHVVVRVLGVQLQAFDIAGTNYSKASECFIDHLPMEAKKTGDWNIRKSNKTCARYKFSAVANVTYETVLGKKATTVFVLDNTTADFTGSCGNNVSILTLNIDSNSFNFFFNKSNENGNVFDYSLSLFQLSYSPKSKYFPNHANNTHDQNVYITAANLSMFQSSSDHSYKCNAETSFMFNDVNSVSFKNVQVQPFDITANGDFSKADDCAPDEDLSPIIPIVVGSVLAFLVVLVIVAYVIGRKRARSVEYEQI